MSREERAEDARVSVHIGKQIIGVLSVNDSNIVREAMDDLGVKAIRFDAVAWGNDKEHGWITLGLPGQDPGH